MFHIGQPFYRTICAAAAMCLANGVATGAPANAEVILNGDVYWETDFESVNVNSFPSSSSVGWERWGAWDTHVQLASDGSGEHVLRVDKSGSGGSTGARVTFEEDLAESGVATRGVASFRLYVSQVSQSNEVEIFRAMKDPGASLTGGNTGFGIESRYSPTAEETRFRLWYGASASLTDFAIEQGVWYDISIEYDFTDESEDTFRFTISDGNRQEEFLHSRTTGRVGQIGGWITLNRNNDPSVYEFDSVSFAVPEPASASLLLIGSCLFLARNRQTCP